MAHATSYGDQSRLRLGGLPALQAGRGDGLDEVMAIFAFLILPLDFPPAQPFRLPFTVLLLAYGAYRWRAVLPVLWQGRWFFALPALCLLSMLWADRPMTALRHGALITLTMGTAALFATRLDFRQVAVAVLLSQGVLAVASLFFQTVEWMGGMDGGYAMLGVFPHKNVLGQRMVFLTLAAGAILFARGYRTPWRVLAMAMIPIALYLVAKSLSATAVILLSILLPLAVILALVWRHAAIVRGMRAAIVLGLVAISAMTLLVLTNFYGVHPIDDFLAAFGKDRTLTGRTEIWALGNQSIAESPWLGVGAANFWVIDNWTALQLTTRLRSVTEQFSFHNLYYQIIVDLGVVGLLCALAVYGRGFYVAGRQWWQHQRDGDPFYISLATAFLIRSFSEAELFYALVMGPILFWIVVFSATQQTRSR